ncbi:MAG: S8 family peptidase [Desulfurococcaceae archaeon]
MGKDRLLMALPILILTLLTAVVLEAQVQPSRSLRIIVRITGEVAKYRELLKVHGVIHGEVSELNAIVMEVQENAVKTLMKLPFVKHVERDEEYSALSEVTWNVEMINATSVWTNYNSTYGDAAYGYSESIRVAVVDTGIDYNHKDLQGSVSWCIVSLNNGKTFYKGTNLRNCRDTNGHGTHVAGIIAARLNGVGVAGVAPKVYLYAVKVLGSSGSGYVSDVARGIVEATKGPDGIPGNLDDADVISMSLGGPDSSLLHDAVVYAYGYNVTLVAASGNEGASDPSYPARYPEVIAVGAIDIDYNVPEWSNRNPDFVAPGVNVLSTYLNNKYSYMSGTSMACPHASAAIALIQALRLASGLPKLTPEEVKDVLAKTAIDLGSEGPDNVYGYGLIDARRAVDLALSGET